MLVILSSAKNAYLDIVHKCRLGSTFFTLPPPPPPPTNPIPTRGRQDRYDHLFLHRSSQRRQYINIVPHVAA